MVRDMQTIAHTSASIWLYRHANAVIQAAVHARALTNIAELHFLTDCDDKEHHLERPCITCIPIHAQESNGDPPQAAKKSEKLEQEDPLILQQSSNTQ